MHAVMQSVYAAIFQQLSAPFYMNLANVDPNQTLNEENSYRMQWRNCNPGGASRLTMSMCSGRASVVNAKLIACSLATTLYVCIKIQRHNVAWTHA